MAHKKKSEAGPMTIRNQTPQVDRAGFRSVTVRLDADVMKSLAENREGYETPNRTLRRLLGLTVEADRRGR